MERLKRFFKRKPPKEYWDEDSVLVREIWNKAHPEDQKGSTSRPVMTDVVIVLIDEIKRLRRKESAI